MNVAVIHPGVQHSWQTATALQQLGQLEFYATSIFQDPARWPYRAARYLPGFLSAPLNREFARFEHGALDPALVRTGGWHEWAERLAQRAGAGALARRIDLAGNRAFVRQVEADLRSAREFAVWAYNNSSLESFRVAREVGRSTVLDRTIADHRYWRELLPDLRERNGDFFLPGRHDAGDAVIAREDAEYALADLIVCGSAFAAETVRAHSTHPVEGKVRVLPYCYDAVNFAEAAAPRATDGPLKVLFAGQVHVRKGVAEFLRAFKRLPQGSVELTLLGSLQVPPAAFAPYAERVGHIPQVARSEVAAIMRAHDILILPSWFEGAPIVLFEALAAGLGIIHSRPAGDAVTPETGLVLPEITPDAIEAALVHCIDSRDEVASWQEAAPVRARDFSFARYQENIADLIAALDAA